MPAENGRRWWICHEFLHSNQPPGFPGPGHDGKLFGTLALDGRQLVDVAVNVQTWPAKRMELKNQIQNLQLLSVAPTLRMSENLRRPKQYDQELIKTDPCSLGRPAKKSIVYACTHIRLYMCAYMLVPR